MAETAIIDFRTEPSLYKHWKLSLENGVAYLTMDVNEDGGLRPGNRRGASRAKRAIRADAPGGDDTALLSIERRDAAASRPRVADARARRARQLAADHATGGEGARKNKSRCIEKDAGAGREGSR